MPSFRTATVTAIISQRTGIERVETDAGPAFVLTQLTGPVAVGDEVVLNTTAVELGLGTGGWHVVHWNLSRREWAEPGTGDIMKLRYTSLQADVGAAEEELGDSDEIDHRGDLDDMPVVVCSLHSQVAPVAGAVRALRPEAVIAYVMTDGAALPLALSDLVAGLTSAGFLDHTLTAGHAFGGELEAVNVPSALSLARHRLGADVVIVAMGPGVVGTGTRLGTTALEVAPTLDAAAWLGGQPIACVRVSDADQRARHSGVSHHTLTALDAVRSRVVVAALPGLFHDHLEVIARHDVRVVTDPPDVAAALTRAGLTVTTMGRGPDVEPRFFAAAAAAGVLAAGLL